MVRIFADKAGSGEFIVQTTAVDVDTFISELAEAFSAAMTNTEDSEIASFGILKNAMPIAFKLAGYKAEAVSEQRTLVCGFISPETCEVLASAGR